MKIAVSLLLALLSSIPSVANNNNNGGQKATVEYVDGKFNILQSQLDDLEGVLVEFANSICQSVNFQLAPACNHRVPENAVSAGAGDTCRACL